MINWCWFFLSQVLVQEVATKQPDFDKVCSEGKSILQLAHPQAVPVLDSKLQQLEKKWHDLRGKMGMSLKFCGCD